MKKQVVSVIATVLLVCGAQYANAVPIEPDAAVSDQLKGQTKLMNVMVTLVRASGYRCDSISAARKMAFSRGFVLICNKYAYEYDIEDKGGNWRVTVK